MLMVRNLPIRVNTLRVFEHLDALGFAGKYDSAFFPVDQRTGKHLGYGFLNMIDSESARQMQVTVSGTQLKGTASKKVIEVCAAVRQGVVPSLKTWQRSAQHARALGRHPPVRFWVRQEGQMTAEW